MPVGTTLAFSAIPAATLVAGGAITFWRAPTAFQRGLILHFGAGVVFAAAAAEVLPEAVKERSPIPVIVGFAIGILSMLLVKLMGARLAGEGEAAPEATDAGAGGSRSATPAAEGPGAPAEPRAGSSSAAPPDAASPSTGIAGEATGAGGRARNPVGLLASFGVDLLIDGLLVGVAFSVGLRQGELMAGAMSAETFALGLALASGIAGRLSRGASWLTLVGMGVLLILGALIGELVLHQLAQPIVTGVLAFGLAALLYLVTEELLVEAHEGKEAPIVTGFFFAGFLLFLVVGMLGA